MTDSILNEVKRVIKASVGGEGFPVDLNEDFQLVGNILDSMSVTNLILALEEHFGFLFEEDELSVESFQTVETLTCLVEKKIGT